MSELVMDQEQEQAPRYVRQAWLVDLDRSLIKSDELVSVVKDYMLESHWIVDESSVADLNDFVESVRAKKGGSVQPYEYMRSAFDLEKDPKKLAKLAVDTLGLEEVRDRVLIDGVPELFEALDETEGIDYALLTHAHDTVGQQFKIEVLRLLLEMDEGKELPYYIVTDETKAATALKQYDTNHGRFILPKPDNGGAGWSAETVVVLDDKVENLQTDHEDPLLLGAVIPIHLHTDGKSLDQLRSVSVRKVAAAITTGGIDAAEVLRWQQDEAA